MQPFGQKLVAGETWKWTVSLADYAAPTYVLKYYFRGPKKLDVTFTASGSDHTAEVSASTTGALTPGYYEYQAVVTKAGEVYQVARGGVEVVAGLEAAGEGHDGRSLVKKTLDAIRANLHGLASREEQQYQINGRQLTLMSREQLLMLEGEFAARYRNELMENGQLSKNSSQVKVRFTCPA